MEMNASMKAISIIVEKLGWQDRSAEAVLQDTLLMVHNRQAGMMDCCGECDSFDDELCSLAIQTADVIVSSLYISDLESSCWWNQICKDLSVSPMEMHNLIEGTSAVQAEVAAEEEDARLRAEEEALQAWYDPVFTLKYGMP